MAELVATMVVGPLLSIVKEKASSYLLDQYKVMKGMEEQHEILMRKLPAILDIITDAEQAAAHREGAAAWLGAIKKVAYEANEVFDEFKYEALRRKAKKEGHYKELGFHVVKLFPTHNRYIFRNRMGRKLSKIVQTIEILVTEMNAFGFKYEQQPPVSKQLRQTDHEIFDPEKISSRSRASDCEIIVDTLVGQASNANLAVLPIVGMGGLGKTTLAQLVYNDPTIQKHFSLLLWVCVSDSFDVDSLAKSIIEAVCKKEDDGKETAPMKKNDGTDATAASKKTPLDRLQNIVSGRRYLLVLDDVWKREIHNWEKLKAILQRGGMGSAVLTTTRDEGVAEIMRTVEAYNLKALEDKFIKKIIETRAFSCFRTKDDRPAALVDMVGEIVKRCCGSPLAATALGSVLRNKTSKEEWKALSSRSNICTEESGILPILKLSYNDLPSHMKQCFAFCAIFPKDYEIDVDKLIQLWIAHGFIIQEKSVRPEIFGQRIFDELASRSFFQDVKQVQATYIDIEYNGAGYSRTTCKIHDLMHDVALSVMEKECAFATEELDKVASVVTTEESSQSDWLPNTARHLYVACKEPGKKMNSSLENSSPTIRTLLCDSNMKNSLKHLSKYSSLQALQLCSKRRSFPLKPKQLHHLRYLDLSRSRIKALPGDMSILYNLQTLNLSGCKYLRRLPREMKYMTALRHLYTHGCPELKRMPRDLGKLTSLQTLTCFVAGSGCNCSNIGELGNLNLGGQLELCHLENVTEEDAEAANLVNKTELAELTLKWTEETSCEDDEKLLQKLKPHDGLHAIRIDAYGATTFPAWMAMLQNIVDIHLFNCSKLQWLFNSGTSLAFPNVKKLRLQRLVCLERLWEIYDDEIHEVIFPQLEMLFISYCEKLTALPGHPTFPNLQDVYIWECPQLKTTAKSPKLSVLDLKGDVAELLLWVARHMTSLTNVKLINHEYRTLFGDSCTQTTWAAAKHSLREMVNNKETWNGHDFPLAVLELDGFKYVAELCACFVHLTDLTIRSSDTFVHWPEKEFQGLVSLRKLEIAYCERLTGYAPALAEPPTSSQTGQLLPRLESLEIHYCHRLVEVFNIPPSLRTMEFNGCADLQSPFGRRVQQGQSSSITEVSASSPGAGAELLEELIIWYCGSLTGVRNLPPSLKYLRIGLCYELTSLESRSGVLPSLEYLQLSNCNSLSSLPDGLQAYSSLKCLLIHGCPGMKTLPTSLQQRLGSLQEEDIDSRHYGNKPRLLKPDTWKYVIRKD